LSRKRKKAEETLLDLSDQAEELAFDKEMREKAEKEVRTLNDQADAYGEELMCLQGLNTNLEEALKEAENHMKAALGGSAEVAEAFPIREHDHDTTLYQVPFLHHPEREPSGNHLRDCLVTGFSMAAEGEFALSLLYFLSVRGSLTMHCILRWC
jgi:hypothetical protein